MQRNSRDPVQLGLRAADFHISSTDLSRSRSEMLEQKLKKLHTRCEIGAKGRETAEKLVHEVRLIFFSRLPLALLVVPVS
jgi:hypothetical protein